MMIVLFWVFLAVIAYVYLGYPVILAAGLLGRRKPIHMASTFPFLSIIIPAHNEESVIEKKLHNVLALTYPRDQLEILVGSDGSTDHTEDIVRRFSDVGVRLVSCPENRGKSSIQNDLVAESKGQILIFTDADSVLPNNILQIMVENFSDPQVALVTSRPVFLNAQETAVVENEGVYWRYEHWLRQQESDRGLLAMASGYLFALRREFWNELDPSVGDDFVLPLQVALRGHRNVVEPRASVGSQLTQKLPHLMLQMKMRIISKDLRGLLSNGAILNPLRTGGIAISLWSHKLLRWLVPYLLIGLFFSNLSLALNGGLYGLFLAIQLLFYALAAAGFALGPLALRSPCSVPMSFCLVNVAALLGTLHCASGQTIGRWRTVR